jgi:hypothetical protein
MEGAARSSRGPGMVSTASDYQAESGFASGRRLTVPAVPAHPQGGRLRKPRAVDPSRSRRQLSHW